jgi:hypothetical protein
MAADRHILDSICLAAGRVAFAVFDWRLAVGIERKQIGKIGSVLVEMAAGSAKSYFGERNNPMTYRPPILVTRCRGLTPAKE